MPMDADSMRRPLSSRRTITGESASYEALNVRGDLDAAAGSGQELRAIATAAEATAAAVASTASGAPSFTETATSRTSSEEGGAMARRSSRRRGRLQPSRKIFDEGDVDVTWTSTWNNKQK